MGLRPVGPAGPEGPEGPQGVQGPQGIQGLTGPRGPSGVLAVKQYSAVSDSLLISTNSLSFVDVSATNASVSFVAPVSGTVVVQLQAMCNAGGAANGYYWALNNGSGDFGSRFCQRANARYGTGGIDGADGAAGPLGPADAPLRWRCAR